MSLPEVILATLFPPVAVLMRYGLGNKFWLNLGLTVAGFLPGVVHAFILLAREPYMLSA